MSDSMNETIKKLRKKIGFTQEELAEQLGVTSQAVSRWESGTGLPDIGFLVPLSRILGVSTDVLLGVGLETKDVAYLSTVNDKVDKIMSSDKKEDVKLLEAYMFIKEETDKRPSEYELLCKCLELGAGISLHTDFHQFLADDPEQREKIFHDCIQIAGRIICYSTNRILVERAHTAVAWIYMHIKQFDKAREHVAVLPSYEANRMMEPMLAKIEFFENGYASQKVCIDENLKKLAYVVGKEFCYDMENYAWNDSQDEAEAFGKWILGIANAFMEREGMDKCWEQYIKKINSYLEITRKK